MKSVLTVFLTLTLFAGTAFSEELTEDKKKLIDTLLTKTGAADMGQMYSRAIIAQMVAVIKKAKPEVNPRAFDTVEEEVNKLIHEEVVTNNALNEMIYPIYNKYFTKDEISELIEFYNTPLGQKLISVTPSLTQESMQAGQMWGQSLGPKIQQRISDRLDKEGIELN